MHDGNRVGAHGGRCGRRALTASPSKAGRYAQWSTATATASGYRTSSRPRGAAPGPPRPILRHSRQSLRSPPLLRHPKSRDHSGPGDGAGRVTADFKPFVALGPRVDRGCCNLARSSTPGLACSRPRGPRRRPRVQLFAFSGPGQSAELRNVRRGSVFFSDCVASTGLGLIRKRAVRRGSLGRCRRRSSSPGTGARGRTLSSGALRCRSPVSALASAERSASERDQLGAARNEDLVLRSSKSRQRLGDVLFVRGSRRAG